MAEQTTYQMVKTKRDDNTTRRETMAKTAELLDPYSNPYKMTYDSGTPVRDIIIVTSNAATIMVEAIISQTLAGEWQAIVEGKLSATRKTYIEDVLSRMDGLTDAFVLDTFDVLSFNSKLVRGIFEQGMAGVINLTQVQNGKLKHYCQVLDMAKTEYEGGKDGWIAPWGTYKKRQLERMYKSYPKVLTALADVNDTKELELVDWFGAEKHELWLAEKLIFSQPNRFGVVPGVVVDVGDDVLKPIRHLVEAMSRALSIEASLGMLTLKPSRQRPVKNYNDSEPSMTPPPPGKSIDLPEGELFQNLENPDLNQAHRDFKDSLYKMFAEAGISDAELGSVDPTMSGVAIYAKQAIRQARRRPFYEGLEVLKSKLARLRIEQLIKSSKGGKVISLGLAGSKMDFSVDRLGDPEDYTIRYRLNTKTKEEELAAIAEATAAVGAGVPREVIDRDIMQAENPEEWQRLRLMAKADEADSLNTLIKAMVAYIQEGDSKADEKEANLCYALARNVKDNCLKIIRERKMPQQPMPVGGASTVTKPDESKPNTGNLVAAMMPKTGV